jgi:type IV pilus assembly protein PilV
MNARKQQGIALVEALLAVVLLAIGLLGTVGLQARSYSALSEAGMRAEATIAAEKLLGVMATDQDNLAAYALAANVRPSTRLTPWYNETVGHIPNAAITITVTPAAGTTRTAVTIRIGWTRKSGDAANAHTITSYIARSA